MFHKKLDLPQYCCIKCKYTPHVDPKDYHKYIGTTIHCYLCGEETEPQCCCNHFTLPPNKDS